MTMAGAEELVVQILSDAYPFVSRERMRDLLEEAEGALYDRALWVYAELGILWGWPESGGGEPRGLVGR